MLLQTVFPHFNDKIKMCYFYRNNILYLWYFIHSDRDNNEKKMQKTLDDWSFKIYKYTTIRKLCQLFSIQPTYLLLFVRME